MYSYRTSFNLTRKYNVVYIKVEAMKICSRRKTGKSTTEFSKLYDGLQSWCRDCSKNYRIHRKLKNPTQKTHLYIMSYSGGQPNVYKVGQSCNIEHRVHTLESSHIFHMTVHAIYPFQGFLESYVHDSLNPYRIKGFKITRVVRMFPRPHLASNFHRNRK